MHHLRAILAIYTFLIVATCSLQNLTVIVSMMEFARLWRFAVCNIYARLQFASWRPFFEKSFFLSEFRTRCENIFFFWGTIQEAGAERERERESQMGRIRRPTRTRPIITVRKNQMVLQRHNQLKYLIVVMVPTSMFWSSLSLYLYLSFSDYLYLSLWIWIR